MEGTNSTLGFPVSAGMGSLLIIYSTMNTQVQIEQKQIIWIIGIYRFQLEWIST